MTQFIAHASQTLLLTAQWCFLSTLCSVYSTPVLAQATYQHEEVVVVSLLVQVAVDEWFHLPPLVGVRPKEPATSWGEGPFVKVAHVERNASATKIFLFNAYISNF